MKFLIIGAGFSGATLARQLVEAMDCEIEIWDERSHIGGNCHTERDPETGVMVHQYGPHIFNTDNERVWTYVQKFGDFRPFVNRVKAVTGRGVFSLPINLLTINQFFGKVMNPSEAETFVASLGDRSINEPANFEEQALKMLGRDLYETFFKGYTIKQWGCDPKQLPASVLKRLPVRFNYDDNYYNKKYQGIPAEGYTEVIRRIADHPRIKISTGRRFGRGDLNGQGPRYAHCFYTGPIDAFFGYSEGRLGYRTVFFEKISTDTQDYQGNAVVNYPDMTVPWTRIHEHKHFAPWEKHEKTSAFKEFSKETEAGDIPYYPKRLAADKSVLAKYRALAEDKASEAIGQRTCGVSFLGRLATYRYMDMEAVIGEALEFSDSFTLAWQAKRTLPVFPNVES
jgi:UDP-galactopyranose mutase